jgi:hypothetical protein
MPDPDYKALCAELINHLQVRVSNEDREISTVGYYSQSQQLLDRARAALAQPAPAVAPLINAGSERLRLVAGGICSGYMAGHNATVEGHYGDPDEVASEMASMVLAELGSVPQSEPVAPTDEDVTELFYRHMGEGSEVGFENAIAEALARWGQP